MYFRARNGTFQKVPQKGNVNFESANGGMTVYYIPPYDGTKVTAFKPVGSWNSYSVISRVVSWAGFWC
jgi:hypothetical protein